MKIFLLIQNSSPKLRSAPLKHFFWSKLQQWRFATSTHMFPCVAAVRSSLCNRLYNTQPQASAQPSSRLSSLLHCIEKHLTPTGIMYFVITSEK